MLDSLRQPRWLAAGAIVLLLAAVFIRLGVWQLDRHQQRQDDNASGLARLSTPPASLDELLDEAGGDIAAIEFRRATVEGKFDPASEVLIRSQVDLGVAGFHVITPLVLADDVAVLVNRGWVPLVMDSTPIEAAPPSGIVTVEGWVELSATRPPLGAIEPEGRLDILNRVDIGRIEEQVPYDLLPVYVVATGDRDVIPRPQRPPDFTETGPHLAYAVQWFGFALIGLVGFSALARRAAQSR